MATNFAVTTLDKINCPKLTLPVATHLQGDIERIA